MQTLPEEMVAHILSYVTGRFDVARCKCVNMRWNALCLSDCHLRLNKDDSYDLMKGCCVKCLLNNVRTMGCINVNGQMHCAQHYALNRWHVCDKIIHNSDGIQHKCCLVKRSWLIQLVVNEGPPSCPGRCAWFHKWYYDRSVDGIVDRTVYGDIVFSSCAQCDTLAILRNGKCGKCHCLGHHSPYAHIVNEHTASRDH